MKHNFQNDVIKIVPSEELYVRKSSLVHDYI